MIKKVKEWIAKQDKCQDCGETEGLIKYGNKQNITILCKKCEEDSQWYELCLNEQKNET